MDVTLVRSIKIFLSIGKMLKIPSKKRILGRNPAAGAPERRGVFQHFCLILGPVPLLYGPLNWRGGGGPSLPQIGVIRAAFSPLPPPPSTHSLQNGNIGAKLSILRYIASYVGGQ